MTTLSRISSVAIVLPAFNAEKDLPALLERIVKNLTGRTFQYEVIVVDDCSTDRTAEIAFEASRSMPLRLMRHDVHLGLGAAMQAGLCAAMNRADAVIVMNADNSHDPFHVQAMVAELEKGEAHIVIASRFRKESVAMGVPRLRRLLSVGGSLMMKALVPFPFVNDYTTGFRAYRPSILRRLASVSGREDFTQERGAACMLEVLLKLRNVGACVAEIPCTLRQDLSRGPGKVSVWRTLAGYMSVVNRCRRERSIAENDSAPQTSGA